MFNLKAQLLKAGLVTEERVKEVEDRQKNHRQSARPRAEKSVELVVESDEDFEARQRAKQLAELKAMGRNEQYGLIRRWVNRNRLDKQVSPLSENSERYFFQKEDNTISWLTLEADVCGAVNAGKAGIIAYMSDHGAAHCVVPRDIAEDVREVFPQWVRVLKDLDA